MHARKSEETLGARPKVKWKWLPFHKLGAENCYKILQLRAKIFIEEQGYAFNDLDDRDQNALHLLGFEKSFNKHDKRLIAYARLMFPKKKEVEIGRVVVHENYRQYGIGTALLTKIIDKIDHSYANYQTTLTIGTDKYCGHLPKFYKKFGFEFVGNQMPTEHVNYTYKNFSFPSLEMMRKGKVKDKNKLQSLKHHALTFFSHKKYLKILQDHPQKSLPVRRPTVR